MKIALLGDIALFGSFSRIKNINLSDNLKEVANYLSTFDYVVGNLETPFTAAKKKFGAKSAYIFAEPEDVTILQFLHINAVTLANNHMFDYGIEGYELTKKLLNKVGIEWFGCEGKELRIEIDDNKIAYAGFCCYTSNPLNCVKYGDYGVNAYNLSKAKDFIETNRNKGYLPIIGVHAGLEHVNYPSLDHIRAARQLSEVGSYVYYGHHPHVIQGVEEYNGSLIAHSLGNFCFDDVYSDISTNRPLIELTDNNRTGIILELEIEENKIINWREQTIDILKDGVQIGKAEFNCQEYNLALRNCEQAPDFYSKKRNQILDERLTERKSSRRIGWYLKRCRMRYIKMMFNSRRNSNLYTSNVKNLIRN